MKPSPKTKRVTKPSAKKSISTKSRDPLGSLGGQPTKYREEYCDKIIVLASKGKTFEQIASLFDVHVDTLHEWKKVHPKFSDAYKRAKQENLNFYMKLGQTCLSGKPVKDAEGKARWINMGLWIFWMKARHGWRDEGDHSGDPEDDDLELDFE